MHADLSRSTRAAELMTAVLLINQVVAVACQFLQHTDPRFPLWYFTVDSSILAGLSAAADLAVPRALWLPALRHTAAVGVVVSAVVFAAIIAPASPSGAWFQGHDDAVVRVATVLFHAVAPVLVSAGCLLRCNGIRGCAAVGYAFAWPVAYLIGLCTMVGIRGAAVIPYPFLAPGQMGWGMVGLAAGALALLIAVTGTALGALGRFGCADKSGIGVS
ncbi:Pr6Pr family membrane protein [Mycobacterium sp. SMC-16]|uniref:Pr6Pr family membrane protein n=1 Tax=Mycobacterium sp. SMC-16 TaxID=3385967 RepID=UPI00390C8BEA